MHATYETRDHIALVTLNRPEALNAFTDQMEAELIDCLERSDADDDIRVVVLTGAGQAFCAGMDLAPAENNAPPFVAWRRSATAPVGTQFRVGDTELPYRRDGGGRVALRIFNSRKPVIAAINGHAVGVGITMTLPCDIRVIADSAKVAFPFTRRGFVPESCSSWFLPRLVPMQRAMEWMLSGRTLTAGEVHEAGLTLSIHPSDEVLPAALRIAHDLTTQAAPVSAALTRQLLWKMLTAHDPMTAHRIETRALNELGIAPDADEGVHAFMEKRAPHFNDSVTLAPDYLAEIAGPEFVPWEAS